MGIVIEVDADVPDGRSLHLIDVENLAGGPDVSAEVALAAVDDHRRAMAIRPGDLVRVACNPWLYRRLAFELPQGWSTRFGHGPDGADRVLLDGLTAESVCRRFHRLVVGSGDHAFADLARGVRALGGEVIVVSGRRSRAVDLNQAACHRVVDLRA